MAINKELLELAAKAAGIEHGADRLECGLSLTERDGRHRSLPRWNPLDDDGDALRLAVALGLDLLRTEVDVEAIAALPPYVEVSAHHIVAPHAVERLGEDAAAATRRAIVRAAAEIGRIINYQSDSN